MSSVCLSVCLWRCVLWLNDTSYVKMSEQVHRKYTLLRTWLYFQPPTLTLRASALKLPIPKISDRSYSRQRSTIGYHSNSCDSCLNTLPFQRQHTHTNTVLDWSAVCFSRSHSWLSGRFLNVNFWELWWHSIRNAAIYLKRWKIRGSQTLLMHISWSWKVEFLRPCVKGTRLTKYSMNCIVLTSMRSFIES